MSLARKGAEWPQIQSRPGYFRAEALFLALCAKPAGAADRATSAADIFAAPGAPFHAPPSSNPPSFVPQGVACRCPRTSSPPLPGASSARSSGSAVGESTFEIWLAPLELRRAPRRQAARRRADGDPATGSPSASAGCSRAAPRRVFGNDVEVGAAPATASSGPAAERAAPLASRSTSTPARSTRATASSSSSSATATASPTPPRWRSPSCPGQAYNPLFLHAPPGLGKTHLLHAIGNYVRAFGGGAGVRYTTAEAFTNQFIRALGSRSLDRFKQRLPRRRRAADRRRPVPRQQGQDRGGVLPHLQRASTRPDGSSCSPATGSRGNSSAIEERLRERFESGLVADDRARPTSPRGWRSCASAPRSTASHIDDDDGPRADRRPGHRQRPRTRGSADPGRRLPLAHAAARSTSRLAEDVLDEIHPRRASARPRLDRRRSSRPSRALRAHA